MLTFVGYIGNNVLMLILRELFSNLNVLSVEKKISNVLNIFL